MARYTQEQIAQLLKAYYIDSGECYSKAAKIVGSTAQTVKKYVISAGEEGKQIAQALFMEKATVFSGNIPSVEDLVFDSVDAFSIAFTHFDSEKEEIRKFWEEI